MLLLMMCGLLGAAQAATPVPAPVSWQLSQRTFATNAPITAKFEHLSQPNAKHWVGVWPYPDSGTRSGPWDRASNQGAGSSSWAYLPATTSGSVQLAGLPAGRYAAFLLDRDGYQWLSTPIVFWVTADGQPVREAAQLAASQQSYSDADSVKLHHSGIASPAAKHWIGLWRYVDGPGTAADGPWQFAQSNSSEQYRYVPQTSGEWDVGQLPAGTYAAFLLANDGYQWLAPPALFTVAANPVDPADLQGPPAFNGKATQLKVLQFNIWLRGTAVGSIGPGLIADAIRDMGADVITLSETDAAYGERLLADLATRGYKFHGYGPSKDVGVVSRYPILETAEFNRFAKAVIDVNGTAVAVYSGHLAYQWYVCYLPRGYGGGTPAGNPTSEYGWNQIPSGPITDTALILDLNQKSGRPESIRQFVADAARESAKGRLVIMAGDFNEPSHLDWTEATKHLFDHNGTVVPWESTTLLEQAGFQDAYRTQFPNPVTHPGFTWPSDNPLVAVSKLTWAPAADERDRIDYVFYQGDARLRLTDVAVVGPRSTIVRNQRVQETSDDPILPTPGNWPSDHKSVMATFSIAPLAIDLPTLSAAQQAQPYALSLPVTGGSAPYQFSVVAGALPPGMTLSSDGQLNGTPTAAGDFDFTVAVRDAQGRSAERAYRLTVAAATAVASRLQVSASPNPARVGEAVQVSVSVVPDVAAQAKAAAVPTGTVTISQNGTTVASLSLTGGAASWASPGFAAGQHTLLVQYGGDALHAASSQQFVQVAQAAPAPQTQAVPSLGGWALAGLGALMLALGLRRRSALG